MKAHIFRDFNYKPAPITSISCNTDTMISFRRNKTFDLIDLRLMYIFLRYEIEYIIVQSEFINESTVLCLTSCNRIILINIRTLNIDILPYRANNIANKLFQSIINFYFTSLNNELFEFKDNKLVLIVKENSSISSLFTINDIVIYGNKNGIIKGYKDGLMIGQIETISKINKITHVDGTKFICALENGEGVLFDIENGIILDKIFIRNNPLLTCISISKDIVHFSGVDSRIIGFVLKNDKFIKIAQADYHISDVLSMIKYKNYIITAGEDSIIIFNELISGKYYQKRIYENSIIYGNCNNNSIMIANDEYIGIFCISDKKKVEKIENQEEENVQKINNKKESEIINKDIEKIGKSGCIENILFDVSSKIFNKINNKETDYEFKLKFNIRSRLLSAAVSSDERYFAYSNNKSCFLYKNENLKISKIKIFEPAKQILFTEKLLIIFSLSYKIIFIDLNSLEIIFEILFKDFREYGRICENNLYLCHSKEIINLSDNFKKLDLEINENIVDISVKNNKPVFFLQNENNERKLILNSEEIFFKENIQFNLVENILFNDREIIIYEKKVKKYKIGNFICGIIKIKNDIIILQLPIYLFKSLIKPSVFKNKYSN